MQDMRLEERDKGPAQSMEWFSSQSDSHISQLNGLSVLLCRRTSGGSWRCQASGPSPARILRRISRHSLRRSSAHQQGDRQTLAILRAKANRVATGTKLQEQERQLVVRSTLRDRDYCGRACCRQVLLEKVLLVVESPRTTERQSLAQHSDTRHAAKSQTSQIYTGDQAHSYSKQPPPRTPQLGPLTAQSCPPPPACTFLSTVSVPDRVGSQE